MWKGGITNLVLSLAARFQGMEEITYFELSMKEKVKIDAKHCYYFGEATKSKHVWDIYSDFKIPMFDAILQTRKMH